MVICVSYISQVVWILDNLVFLSLNTLISSVIPPPIFFVPWIPCFYSTTQRILSFLLLEKTSLTSQIWVKFQELDSLCRKDYIASISRVDEGELILLDYIFSHTKQRYVNNPLVVLILIHIEARCRNHRTCQKTILKPPSSFMSN